MRDDEDVAYLPVVGMYLTAAWEIGHHEGALVKSQHEGEHQTILDGEMQDDSLSLWTMILANEVMGLRRVLGQFAKHGQVQQYHPQRADQSQLNETPAMWG